MDQIFRLPKPRFNNNTGNDDRRKMPHFSTPQGMLLPRKFQPPPMYGPRGSTVPPKYLNDSAKPGPSKQEKFWCETCDRDFNSKQDLHSHLSEHMKCGVDGCSFIGHPMVVERHIAEQHSSGLYDQIKKLSTPEEISQWREERRKRYPTMQNVELRQQAQEAKMKRGEKIDQPKNRFGRRNERRQIQKNVFGKPILNNPKQHRPQKNHTATQQSNPVRKFEAEIKERQEKSDIINGNLPMFTGTSNLLNYEKPKLKKFNDNPLSSLLGVYGSDDESAEDSETESEEESKRLGLGIFEENIPVSETRKLSGSQDPPVKTQTEENNFTVVNKLKVVPESNLNNPKNKQLSNSSNALNSDEKAKLPTHDSASCPQIDNDSSSNDEMPEEVPIQKTTEQEFETPKPSTSYQNSNHLKRKQKHEHTKPKRKFILDYAKTKTKPQNTMLEKLLEPDIRHERNVLLQCVRFVVENNFFGIGSKK